MMELKRYYPLYGRYDNEGDNGEYVRYSDVEKCVKLWEMMIRPKRGLSCFMCDYKKFYAYAYCTLFDKPINNGRCQQCLDIFGGE